MNVECEVNRRIKAKKKNFSSQDNGFDVLFLLRCDQLGEENFWIQCENQ